MLTKDVFVTDLLVAYEWIEELIHWWIKQWERIDHCIENIIEANSLRFAS